MHPHELFEDKYDYSIYVDGNILCVSDVSSFVNEINNKIGIAMHKHCCRNCIYDEAKILKIVKKGNLKKLDEQIQKYKNKRFPEKYGLLEANVIVTDLNNNYAKKIYNDWWEEFASTKSNRDQISLPYILWNNNVEIDKVGTLGNNVYDNPKIQKKDHLL